MKIRELIWQDERVEHIARHGVSPEEVEEVCFAKPLVIQGRSEGPNPVYYVLGRTISGRAIFCVVIHFGEGKGFPVTARPMTEAERKRYTSWRSQRR